MTDYEIDKHAKIIWDYHHLNQEVKKSDCIFALCSLDTRVAEYAADLYLRRLASCIIFSGGFGELTKDLFKKTEAEVFADIACSRGVPKEKIIIENKSTNTGENVFFTKSLLEKSGLNFKSFILVQKPYMERRTYATFKKIWPEKEFTVTSPPVSFEEYPNTINPKNKVINIMVGDLQRIKVYAERGFQIPQEIPDKVWQSYEMLVAAGFTNHLLKISHSSNL